MKKIKSNFNLSSFINHQITKTTVSKFLLNNSFKIEYNNNFNESSTNISDNFYKSKILNLYKSERIKINFLKFQTKTFSTGKNVDKDGFPLPEKRDIYDEDDMIINIGDKEKFKGMLIICPTPIGNINDISIRQFEAMKNGDILACEDTRKTGKLLEFIQLKKMKEKFYAEFGISFEEFVNLGGLNMTDEQIKSKILNKGEINQNNINENKEQSDDFNTYFDETKKVKTKFILFSRMKMKQFLMIQKII